MLVKRECGTAIPSFKSFLVLWWWEVSITLTNGMLLLCSSPRTSAAHENQHWMKESTKFQGNDEELFPSSGNKRITKGVASTYLLLCCVSCLFFVPHINWATGHRRCGCQNRSHGRDYHWTHEQWIWWHLAIVWENHTVAGTCFKLNLLGSRSLISSLTSSLSLLSCFLLSYFLLFFLSFSPSFLLHIARVRKLTKASPISGR